MGYLRKEEIPPGTEDQRRGGLDGGMNWQWMMDTGAVTVGTKTAPLPVCLA